MSQTFFCPYCGAIQSHAVFQAGPIAPCTACGKELNAFAIDGPLISSPNDTDSDEDNSVSFGRKTEEAEMDMTPMVDIVFQLLIFFMVTASFALQRAMEIPKPDDNRPSTATQTPKDIENDSDFVVVRVDSLGSFHVLAVDWDQEEDAPSQQELIIKLKRARGGGSDGKVPHKMLVKAHGDAAHGRVVLALDAGPIVGLREVQLQTIEEDE